MIELFPREGIGRHDVQRIALHGADEGQRHAGAAAGVFDDRAAGPRRPSASAASIMASAIRSFMLPVGFSLSSFSRMRAPLAGASARQRRASRLSRRCRPRGCRGRGVRSSRHFHVSANYVSTCNHDDRKTTAKDASHRCPRAGRDLRGLEQPARGPAHHPIPRPRAGGSGPYGGAARPDGADRRGLRRYARRARPAHRPRPIDAVAQPAHARGRGAGRDRRRQDRPAAPVGLAHRDRRAAARGGDPGLAQGPREARTTLPPELARRLAEAAQALSDDRA